MIVGAGGISLSSHLYAEDNELVNFLRKEKKLLVSSILGYRVALD